MSREALFPNNPGAACDLDTLRPAFNRHVIGPLGHYLVVNSIENCKSVFLDTMGSDYGATATSAGAPGRMSQLSRTTQALDMLTIVENHLLEHMRSKAAGVWDLLTDDQQTAARRFTSFANDPGWQDKAFLRETSTIHHAIQMFGAHHPELNLGRLPSLLAFLRHPATPTLLRGLTPGGNGFLDGIRNHPLNFHPITEPWRTDRTKPALHTESVPPRLTRELRTAAHQHRQATRQVATTSLNNGVRELAFRYSDGCPMRRLKFGILHPDLVEYDLSLNEQQLAVLCDPKTGVAETLPTPEIDETAETSEEGSANNKRLALTHRITRDGLAAYCITLAAGIEAAAWGLSK